MFKKLRNKMLVGIALVSLFPFLAAGLFVLYLISQAHNEDVASIERNLLEEKTLQVQKYFSDSIDQITVILPLPTDYLVRPLRPTENVSGVPVATTTDGGRIAFAINPPSQLNDILTTALSTNRAFKELYFVDRGTGLEVAYDARDASDSYQGDLFADFSKLPQIQAINGGARSYVGPANMTMKGPLVEVAAPVENASNTTIGALAGELDLSGMKNIFAGTALGNTGYVYLIDPQGDILYNSDPTKAPSGGISSFTPPFTPATMDQAAYRSVWGESVIAAERIVNVPGSSAPWKMVAEWPAGDANQVINRLEEELIFFLGLMFLLTVLMSLFLADRVVRPIDVLRAGTERIATGEFNIPVKIKTKDELEELGTAFNSMMAGLKRLQELKDEFVFIAAHELRTPVAAMKGYLELLMGGSAGSVDDTAKSFIGKIIDVNRRLVQLVNDLLQVARSDAGRLTIQVTSIDVAVQVRTTLDELKPLADDKSITMNFAPSGTTTAMADPDRLKEVLVNLVGNAIKYSGNGTAITVSTEMASDFLIVHVKDGGFGISKEAQAKLFEKFYRVQTEKTKDIQGTGLGLFIVKQIIEKMGGTIWVNSEEGKGSTFNFTLKAS